VSARGVVQAGGCFENTVGLRVIVQAEDFFGELFGCEEDFAVLG
jgi:hypothetical protein